MSDNNPQPFNFLHTAVFSLLGLPATVVPVQLSQASSYSCLYLVSRYYIYIYPAGEAAALGAGGGGALQRPPHPRPGSAAGDGIRGVAQAFQSVIKTLPI